MGDYNAHMQFLIKRAALYYNNNDLQNLKYGLGDRGAPLGVYSLCYHKNFPEYKDFCGPDCFFGGWNSIGIFSFEKTRDEICVASVTPPIINKVGWIGNIYSPDCTVPEHYTRPLLKQYGDNYPDIFDIIHIAPQNAKIHAGIPGYKSLPELTTYKYLIDIGGNGWSGRLKWLLFTNRTLFIIDRNYKEYFFDDLKPFVHYIPVKMNLSDLLEQFMWVINNPTRAEEIAHQAYLFALENFTEEKINKRILFVYKKMQNVAL
jgi:hypothetical protein